MLTNLERGDEEAVVDNDHGSRRNDDGIFLNAVERLENILDQRNLRCTTDSQNVEVTLLPLLCLSIFFFVLVLLL